MASPPSRIRSPRYRAFSLPESVAALGLVAALVALGLGTGRAAAENTRVARARAELVVLQTTLEVERARLIARETRQPSSAWVGAQALRSETLDPWGSPYHLLPADGAGTRRRVVSAGPDGELATEFDNVHPD